jgi:hypothetical protein
LIDLQFRRFLNGQLVSNIVLNTTQAATDPIDYHRPSGLSATSTRTVVVVAPDSTDDSVESQQGSPTGVIIEASPSIVPTDDASSTAATTGTQ